jgi:hypothetical protein
MRPAAILSQGKAKRTPHARPVLGVHEPRAKTASNMPV